MSVFDRRCRHCSILLGDDGSWRYAHSLCRLCERLRRRAQEHGLPIEALREAWDRQQGRCAICRVDLDPSLPANVHVDHGHHTELLRGFLCRSCNHGLGFFKDDPSLIDRALNYLCPREGEERPEIYRRRKTRSAAEELVYQRKLAEEKAEDDRRVHEALVRILGPDYKEKYD